MGQIANIFTDSAYAQGVCHLFRAVWKQRGFKKSNGTPIQHAKQIGQLMSAMMLPKLLVVVKCQAHKRWNDYVIKGNNIADSKAKKASGCQTAVLAPVVLIEPQPRFAGHSSDSTASRCIWTLYVAPEKRSERCTGNLGFTWRSNHCTHHTRKHFDSRCSWIWPLCKRGGYVKYVPRIMLGMGHKLAIYRYQMGHLNTYCSDGLCGYE